jgi:hypothetical protein
MRPFQEWNDMDLHDYFLRYENISRLEQLIATTQQVDVLKEHVETSAVDRDELERVYSEDIYPRVVHSLGIRPSSKPLPIFSANPSLSTKAWYSALKSELTIEREWNQLLNYVAGATAVAGLNMFYAWCLSSLSFFSGGIEESVINMAAGAIVGVGVKAFVDGFIRLPRSDGFVIPEDVSRFYCSTECVSEYIMAHELVHCLDKNLTSNDRLLVAEGVAEAVSIPYRERFSGDENYRLDSLRYARDYLIRVGGNYSLVGNYSCTPGEGVDPYAIGFAAVELLKDEFGSHVVRELMGYES